MIKYLLTNGVKKNMVYEVFGKLNDPEELMDYDLSIEEIHKLSLLIKNQLGIALCGLEISQFIDSQDTGFFGPYAFSCPNLEDAVNKIHVIYKKLNPLLSYEMIPENKPSKFVYHLDNIWEARYPDTAADMIDFAIANGLSFSRKATKLEIVPLSLELKRESPAEISLYEEIYKCKVFFNRESNVINYPSDTLQYKIPTYNPTLLEIMEEHAAKTIKEHELKKDFVSEVKMLLIRATKFKIPVEEEIAMHLNMSKRTLQNKLKDKNTTFKKILEEVQKDLAISYLRSGQISNKEISWILGYNDISNFYRAFKQWTGMTPNKLRAETN
jgi:AraC-like DNA-binding protein